jgi:16S rRNA (uracil1498-N3)-methyltransferase
LRQPGTHRVYVDETLQSGVQLILPVEQSHYVNRVLRLKPTEALTLFNGKGGEFSAVIVTVSRHGVAVRVDAHISPTVESPLGVHLVQGVSRGERMDTVVQKATELGISRLTPVLTKFSVVRLDDDAKRDKRTAHWTKIAQSACEQCGRTVPPVIDIPVKFNEWRQQLVQDGYRRIALHPTAASPLASLQPVASRVMLLIGPEGGLSENEIGAATAAGFETCSLGPRILRTETAAIAAIAILQARWGDLV